ncbi:glutathione peroxidase 7-like [Mizuhopecten yessoensis]|uniref:Glutathione peroxidase n=1 Tax=Mizuhopecten yessoensis TaxID=6573 RepID=A0A210QEV7_MIZYE|nr:glutathione peroxidase 7-like [Mizuhopecten yessoensis]OWF47286.1 Glutathione peroxidase 7 [Mizuhopecten yessoensis]
MASVNNINTLQKNMFKKNTISKTIFRWFAMICLITTLFKLSAADALDESGKVSPETRKTDEITTNADDKIFENEEDELQVTSGNNLPDEQTLKTEEDDFYSFNVTDITGIPVSLEQYRGQVSLVVNVASECGFTDDHYKGLVKLHEAYREEDFNVLAFPCNQFGAQEPASNHEIERFAKTVFQVDFPIFAKVNVLNDDVPEAWNYLIDRAGEPPNWNFWKYLVDCDGRLMNAWGPWVAVSEIYYNVEQAIQDCQEKNKIGAVVTESTSTTDPHGGEL